jgi:hypothetical protein
MTTPKARRPRKASKPASETIPLAGVSITIAKPKLFTNDEETVTFDGKALGDALRWISLACPNLPRFTAPTSVGLELAGIAEQCRAIGDANLELIPSDHNALWCSVADRLRDLAARISAGQTVDTPEITITRKPAAEVA